VCGTSYSLLWLKGVARAVSKTIGAGDLFEAREHAEILHPRQECRVQERLVGRGLLPVGCRVGLAEDRNIT
jgi:hypothetical protein